MCKEGQWWSAEKGHRHRHKGQLFFVFLALFLGLRLFFFQLRFPAFEKNFLCLFFSRKRLGERALLCLSTNRAHHVDVHVFELEFIG